MSKRDILLVDDDIQSLQVLSTILEFHGYDVRATSDGIKAMEIIVHDEFSMMITDCDMPKMSGVELAMKVREQHPDLRVVMVTGGNIGDIIEPAVNAGISRVLAKPVKISELIAAVRSSLPAQRMSA